MCVKHIFALLSRSRDKYDKILDYSDGQFTMMQRVPIPVQIKRLSYLSDVFNLKSNGWARLHFFSLYTESNQCFIRPSMCSGAVHLSLCKTSSCNGNNSLGARVGTFSWLCASKAKCTLYLIIFNLIYN